MASLALVTATLVGSSVVFAAPPAWAATPSPASFANTETAQVITLPTMNTAEYTLVGADLDLIGPGAGTDRYDGTAVVVDAMADTVAATFNVDPSGTPAGPGTYTLNVFTTGGEALMLPPLDTATVTITATAPTPTAAAVLQPGDSVPLTISTASGTFSKGDSVTFDKGLGNPAPGMTLTSPTVTGSTISGTLNAAGDLTTGSYTVVVTDTAGAATDCLACIGVDTGPAAVTGLVPSNIADTTASLSWTAPSPDNPTLTGYDVVVSNDASATTTDSGITVTHTGTAATATVSGLTTGTKYYATVTGSSASGPGASATTSFYSHQPTTLTLGRAPSHLTYGETLTLAGNLSEGTGGGATAVPSAPVGLYATVGNGTPKKLGTAHTDGSGNYSLDITPKHNATYAAYFNGVPATSTSPALDATLSNAASATVASLVTLVGKAKHLGQWLLLKGKVSPKEVGRKVVIYQTSGLSLKKFAKVKLNAHSRYRVLRKHLKSGQYTLIAKIKAHGANLAGKSDPVTVTKP